MGEKTTNLDLPDCGPSGHQRGGLRARLFERLLVGLLATAIIAPTAAGLLGVGSGNEAFIIATERRFPTGAPSWRSAVSTPQIAARAYEAFYNDHFPLRIGLITVFDRLKFQIFHDSSSPDVVIGKHGWLFLGSDANQFRNVTPFSNQDLAYWASVLDSRRKWLDSQHIRYILLFVPDKSSLYPEDLPNAINKVHPGSRMDQILQYLKAHTKIQIVDPRLALMRGKQRAEVFSRGDTHWNGFGAFIAFTDLMKAVTRDFPKDNPAPRTSFSMRTLNINGDLINMLGLSGFLANEYLELEPKNKKQAVEAGPLWWRVADWTSGGLTHAALVLRG